MASEGDLETIGRGALERFEERIAAARALGGAEVPLARRGADPLEAMLARVASAQRVAAAAPPLLGIQDAIERSAEMAPAAELFESASGAQEGQDPLTSLVARMRGEREVLGRRVEPLGHAAPLPSPPPASLASAPTEEDEAVPGRAPVSAPAGGGAGDQEKRGEARGPVGDAGELAVSELLLDALATRGLSGDARARAAQLLAEGIARQDDRALRAALAVLVTGG